MINRRDFLASSASVVIASFVSGAGKAAAALPTRYNVKTPPGQDMLKTYASAVKAMKALADKEPRSWTFQWYIHATPASKQSEIQRVFGSSTGPKRNLADETWYTCQNHMNVDGHEDYFFPWHRLYVMYLEEIVRQISGRQEFTLPYWDYTSPDSYAIPVEFQTSNSHNSNWESLFIRNRNVATGAIQGATNVNAGEPLNKNFRGQRNFLVLPDFNNSDYSSFCSGLDGNLHGAVHVFTGDQKNMAQIPYAARDPIFWLHHCNIDRIWAAWNTKWSNPSESNGTSWADTKFVYVDGQGGRVEAALSAISDPSALPYRYDNLPLSEAANEGVAVAGASAKPSSAGWTTILKSGPAGVAAANANVAAPMTAVPLESTAKTVELAPAAPNANLAAAAANATPAGPTRFLLTLRNVAAQGDPNTTYEVFLNLPEAASPETADQHYVGLLNFFGVGNSMAQMNHGGKTIDFDVTKLMVDLRNTKSLGARTTVTFVPVGPPSEGSAPVISGGVELRQRN